MPIVINKLVASDTHLLVWHISEKKEDLLSLVEAYIRTSTEPFRTSLHWLGSRACLAQYFKKEILVEKDIYQKPCLWVADERYFLSITHSFEYAAVIFSKSKEVAIDLEKIDARILRVQQKFCSLDELRQADSDVLKLAWIWSAKETLYKYYGKKGLDFKKNLRVDLETGCRGTLILDSEIRQYSLQQLIINEYVMTYLC